MQSTVSMLVRPLWRAVRNVGTSEVEGKGKYLLKINTDPFTEKNIEVKVEQGSVRVTGKRGQTTGNSNWSHEMDMVFTLPPTLKQDSITTKIEKNTVFVSADTNS